MAALWLLGVSVALLTVDVRCMPVKQDPSSVTTYGWGENAAPGSNRDVYYNVYAPGAGGDRAFAVSQPPQGYGYNVPSGAQAAPSLSSVSALPGNVPAVAPPISPSVGEEASLGPILPGPYFPPQPDYQAGQLSHVERSHEFGDHETETEEGSQSPPFSQPLQMAQGASPLMTSMPRPENFLGGGWGPYPYYDYMFLTGQYPPGTLSYSSNSFEHGRNYWQDVRYRRPSPPYIYPQPVEVPEVPVVPVVPVKSQEQSRYPVKLW